MTMSRPPVTPLAPDQQLAATSPRGPVIIQGDGGCGKTHTIAASIAVALKNGELPARIACITNGTGNARDIKRRVGAFLPGNISALQFLSGTARQLALGLLRVGGAEMLGLPPAFPVLQQDQVLELLCVLLGANRQNRRKSPPRPRGSGPGTCASGQGIRTKSSRGNGKDGCPRFPDTRQRSTPIMPWTRAM